MRECYRGYQVDAFSCQITRKCRLLIYQAELFKKHRKPLLIVTQQLLMKQVHKIVLLEISSCKELQPDAKL